MQAKQLETNHAMSRKHFEQTKDLEVAHLNDIHHLKKRHLEIQHEAETNNQMQYNQRATEELAKRHALQSKQQPKELKVYCSMPFSAFSSFFFKDLIFNVNFLTTNLWN